MPRQLKGTARFRKGRWYARVTLEGDHRPTYLLPTIDSETGARARADFMAGIVMRLRVAGCTDAALGLLARAAMCHEESEIRQVASDVERVCSGKMTIDEARDVAIVSKPFRTSAITIRVAGRMFQITVREVRTNRAAPEPDSSILADLAHGLAS